MSAILKMDPKQTRLGVTMAVFVKQPEFFVLSLVKKYCFKSGVYIELILLANGCKTSS